MSAEKFYEVDGAVFREGDGHMEVYVHRSGSWEPYKGDEYRVRRLSNPMSLEEVKAYMIEPFNDSEPSE